MSESELPRKPSIFSQLLAGEKPTPESISSEVNITGSLRADTGKVLNFERRVFGALTPAGWKLLGECQGVTVKVFLWCLMHLEPAREGALDFRVYKRQQEEISNGLDCNPQSVVNAVGELVKRGLVRRLAPGHLRVDRRYVVEGYVEEKVK